MQALDLVPQPAILFLEQLQLRIRLGLDGTKLRELRAHARDFDLQQAVLLLEPLQLRIRLGLDYPKLRELGVQPLDLVL